MRTVAVVAVKPFAQAKSRLGSLPAPLRRRLAWCMTLDTLAALVDAVDEVLVVSSVPALQTRLALLGPKVRVWPETALQGVNSALRDGAEAARRGGARTVLACVGDLPCLRPATVRTVLHAAPAGGRSFLADASGVGTTMLVADDVDLAPAFQGHSAAAHQAGGARPLDLQLPEARRDVDTEADLTEALRLGVGRATAALVDPATGALGRFSLLTAVADPTGHLDYALSASGDRYVLPGDALADPRIPVRSGQRLQAVLAESTAATVLSAWL